MPSDTLALVAVVFLAASECFAATRIRLAGGLLAAAVALLLAALRRSYVISAMMLTLSAGLAGALSRLAPDVREDRGFLKGVILGKVAPNVLAGFFHLVGLWVLPFLVLWGWTDTYSDSLFFIQDIGHLVPATFYYLALVLFPLLIIPRGYEKGETVHQMYEGAFNFAFAIVYFTIFRTAHWAEGQNPPKMDAANWDHEFLGLVWAGSGATGVLTARAGYKTSAHVAFPAAFICYSMMTHSIPPDLDMSKEPWRMTWMKLHKIHGICFGVGALCRLLYRIPEAVLFFFLGSFAFVFSSKWVSQSLYDALEYHPESQSHNPIDHVAALLVVTVGVVLFPIHLATLGRLRSFVEQFTGYLFEALPVVDESADEYEGRGLGEMEALAKADTNGDAKSRQNSAVEKELALT